MAFSLKFSDTAARQFDALDPPLQDRVKIFLDEIVPGSHCAKKGNYSGPSDRPAFEMKFWVKMPLKIPLSPIKMPIPRSKLVRKTPPSEGPE